MYLISHRGNVNGKSPNGENKPLYIKAALALGYDVEIDVWLLGDRWYLGHDNPETLINIDFLKTNGLWCHAKNIEAAYGMWKEDLHFFYHQTDDITLTSQNYLWTYPGKRPLLPRSIAVMPEGTGWTDDELSNCSGICSDYIDRYNPKLTEEEWRKY